MENINQSAMSVQKHQVGILYRRCLKWIKQFGLPFDLLCEESRKIRNEFEEYRNEKDPSKIDFLVKRAEYWLGYYEHPLPYIFPTHKGGSSYLRYVQIKDDLIAINSQIYNNDKLRQKEWEEEQKKLQKNQ